MSTPANFNGQRPVIDANDAVMLLIDHQSGLFQTVADMPMTELRARAAALPASPPQQTASDHHWPGAAGPQRPADPGDSPVNALHAQYVARKGEINAWDNPDFVAAVVPPAAKPRSSPVPSPASAWPFRPSAVAEG